MMNLNEQSKEGNLNKLMSCYPGAWENQIEYTNQNMPNKYNSSKLNKQAW